MMLMKIRKTIEVDVKNKVNVVNNIKERKE